MTDFLREILLPIHKHSKELIVILSLFGLLRRTPELISSPPSLRCCCSSVETELTGFTFCFDDQRFRAKSASAFTKERGTESNACNCEIDGNWLGVVRLASSQIASLFFLKLQKTSSSTPKHRRSTTLA